MLSASLIQLEYVSKQWKSTFSYSGAKAEILRLEAENKLLREQLKAAEAARKMA